MADELEFRSLIGVIEISEVFKKSGRMITV